MTPQALPAFHQAQGATLADDGIPLHFGDRAREYDAALNAAVLMDRSHEGRLRLEGRDRLALPHRISTNALETLAFGECAPTLFITPNARIIDRATFCHLGETTLALTEPGRAEALLTILRRNIFFNDDMRANDETASTRQFVLYGQQASAILGALGIELAPLHVTLAEIEGNQVTIMHDKPFGGDPLQAIWRVIVPIDSAVAVWSALMTAGAPHGIQPAGSLTYYALRVRAGRPGVNAELSGEYIPLEVGLWDEVSFTKGCYTGQEIISRMDSRRRLARTLVRVTLDAPAASASPLQMNGRTVGTLTSSVETPTGERLGLAVIKLAAAQPGAQLTISEGIHATILDRAGVQPHLQEET